MIVNFEFLDEEPIENLITCMNFQIDKVVFFGYRDLIERKEKQTANFLRTVCKVETVVFHEVTNNNLQSAVDTIRKVVMHEKDKGNDVFFDVTGGDSLIPIAFGMIAKELDAPMHIYDIPGDELVEIRISKTPNISKMTVQRKIPMTLDLYIKMHGGAINMNLHKDIKGLDNPEFMEDVMRIYYVASLNWSCWNTFTNFLRDRMRPSDGLEVSVNSRHVYNLLKSNENSALRGIDKLNEILDSLNRIGILPKVERNAEKYTVSYKNEAIMESLFEGGSVLELYTCYVESQTTDECLVGVHLDWDGIIHDTPGIDVLNEIDVLSLRGNIATFISCKSGKMGSNQSLHALYELETVAGRFGGKYAEKVLVTANPLDEVYMERAKEMGIEVR